MSSVSKEKRWFGIYTLKIDVSKNPYVKPKYFFPEPFLRANNFQALCIIYWLWSCGLVACILHWTEWSCTSFLEKNTQVFNWDNVLTWLWEWALYLWAQMCGVLKAFGYPKAAYLISDFLLKYNQKWGLYLLLKKWH